MGGLCPAAPRRYRRAARSPRDRASRSVLPSGLHPGRQAWHAPACGPLPPRPRHPVSHNWTGRAGPRRAVRRHRALSCHGDDILADARRGGAGAAGRIRRAARHGRLNAWKQTEGYWLRVTYAEEGQTLTVMTVILRRRGPEEE